MSKKLLKRYSIARIPFIAIHTVEVARVLKILKDTSEALGLSFYVHNLSKGVYDLGTDKVISEDRSVYSAIDFMTEQMKRKQYQTMVLTEIPDLSNDNSDARNFISLVQLASETGGVIMVVTDSPVWNQLQRLGMMVSLDRPDEEEMVGIIREYIEDYRHEIPIEWERS